MRKHVQLGDISGFRGDALIYSTNVGLALTGGVGAALLMRFGIAVQIDLHSQSLGAGRRLAQVGDVFTTSINGSPWKRVFHTIVTDEQYHTEAGTVRKVLQSCFRACAATAEVRTIVCSALGSGYGDLDLAHFLTISDQVLREPAASGLESFTVVEFHQEQYLSLCDAAKGMSGWTF